MACRERPYAMAYKRIMTCIEKGVIPMEYLERKKDVSKWESYRRRLGGSNFFMVRLSQQILIQSRIPNLDEKTPKDIYLS